MAGKLFGKLFFPCKVAIKKTFGSTQLQISGRIKKTPSSFSEPLGKMLQLGDFNAKQGDDGESTKRMLFTYPMIKQTDMSEDMRGEVKGTFFDTKTSFCKKITREMSFAIRRCWRSA